MIITSKRIVHGAGQNASCRQTVGRKRWLGQGLVAGAHCNGERDSGDARAGRRLCDCVLGQEHQAVGPELPQDEEGAQGPQPGRVGTPPTPRAEASLGFWRQEHQALGHTRRQVSRDAQWSWGLRARARPAARRELRVRRQRLHGQNLVARPLWQLT